MIVKILTFVALLTIGVWCAPRSALLGAKECTWGPSYWCKNLTSAHGCKAVPHCITNVWEHMTVPNDPDDVCTLCKKMVGEARDQLESNMTMDELKQVFEGSCKLMILKPAVEICSKIADELVPELVDTISSQMNPDVVCSVAGLCNNAEIDNVRDEDEKKYANAADLMPKKKKMDYAPQNCGICSKFAEKTTKKINETKPEDILGYLLDLCGKTSSYSDSCASIVLMNQDPILNFIQTPFVPQEVCTLSGSCVSQRKPMVGDEPCDLCQQLVLHFKDIVTADTTEAEFKKVLLGVCKQTGKFAEECKGLVSEYSDDVFKIISEDLDGKKICGFLNICPAPGVFVNKGLPMLPEQPMQVKVAASTEKPRPTIAYGDVIGKTAYYNLPPSRLIGKPMQSLLSDTKVNGQETCVFCQYLLHFVQKVISQPYGINAIKEAVDKVCDELPSSVSLQCENFVNLYGDAFVAILAQEIDPSQVCPSLKVCPAIELADRYEPTSLVGKPGCPLCLMAISALDEELANNRTEDSVKDALDKLCDRLPKAISKECQQLVSTYTEQLVDMLLADFTPEEVCTYLKICKKPGQVEVVKKATVVAEKKKGKELSDSYGLMTNEVELPAESSEESLESMESDKKVKGSPVCILCEFVLEKIDDMIKNNKTQDGIDKALNEVCSLMPRTIRSDCEKFVVKYTEEIINTLAVMVPPSEVCAYIALCEKNTMQKLKSVVADCAICEQLVQIHAIVTKGENGEVDRARFLMNGCDGVEDNQGRECLDFIHRQGVTLFNKLKTAAPEVACTQLAICTPAQSAKVNPKRSAQPLGADKCTHGPSYWCQSKEVAKKCGAGATKHCQENFWGPDF